MKNETFLGDCLIENEKIKSGSVDLILTDLPYGTMNCVVGDKEGVYTANVYRTEDFTKNLLTKTWENVSTIGDSLGLQGIAFSLLLIVVIMFMFIYSPTTAVFSAILSLVVIYMLGIGSIPFVAISGLVFAGIVVLVVMRK